MKARPESRATKALTSAQALRSAMADLKTARFMRAVFSPPEFRPEISSSTWFRSQGLSSKWLVMVAEKKTCFPRDKESLANIVLVEIDGRSGAVLERECLSSLLDREVRERVNLWLRRGGYRVRRTGPRLRRIVR